MKVQLLHEKGAKRFERQFGRPLRLKDMNLIEFAIYGDVKYLDIDQGNSEKKSINFDIF